MFFFCVHRSYQSSVLAVCIATVMFPEEFLGAYELCYIKAHRYFVVEGYMLREKGTASVQISDVTTVNAEFTFHPEGHLVDRCFFAFQFVIRH